MTSAVARSDILRHIAVRPDDAEAWFGLAIAGQDERRLLRTLAIRPEHLGAVVTVSQAALSSGHRAPALRLLRRAEAADPGRAPVLGNLALHALDIGETIRAIAIFRRILSAAPGDAVSWVNLGKAQERQGDPAAAARSWRLAASIEPTMGLGQLNLGIADLARRPGDAVTRLRRAAALSPGDLEIWNNLGDGLRRTGALDGALAAARRSVAGMPAHEGYLRNLGVSLHEVPDLSGAVRIARRAIAVAPDSSEAHHNLSLFLLTSGRWSEGLREYEWRLRTPGYRPLRSGMPRWMGETLPEATLLVVGEQGLGDVLHFARFVPQAAARVARTVLAVPRPAVRLLQAAFPKIDVVADSGSLPAHDLVIPIMSLPMALHGGKDLPGKWGAYLPRQEAADLPPDDRLTVGLVWAGNPDQPRDRLRSTALADLSPLFAVPGIRWISLQFGARAGALLANEAARYLLDIGDRLGDLAETSRFIAATDLVITVDTAMAHHAGALGHPVWTLLAKVPDWRWGLAGTESAWYPSMRLWRQERHGGWREVAERAADALRRMVEKRGP